MSTDVVTREAIVNRTKRHLEFKGLEALALGFKEACRASDFIED